MLLMMNIHMKGRMWKILFLKIIVSLVLYTYFMVQSSKNPLDIIYDYPPKIVKCVIVKCV